MEKLWKRFPWCPRLTANELRFSHLKLLLMQQSSIDAERFVTRMEELVRHQRQRDLSHVLELGGSS